MNRIAFGGVLLVAALPAAAYAQRAPAAVVVVVDTDRVFRDCTACKVAQVQLEAMVTSATTRAGQISQPLQTEQQSIQQATTAARNQTGDLRASAEAALDKRVQAFETRKNTAAQEMQRLQQNIQSAQANVVRQISEKLSTIYAQIMTAHNANIVLDTKGMLARGGGLDVTDEVLSALNQQLSSVAVTKQ